ncbi:hypothetical protein [Enterococcus sp. CWB-B31]|uniref:hypothetical protein n=1 Tax=Enterococcus sp. CWB-B31 TaxID=2885159 RepID=UPI001E4F4F2D|nr:hypothetical protein [Enterococcus sp. CWB-B31]MCB5956348.1 hypothetical protein [Enterococcus sp. CWB-B31]
MDGKLNYLDNRKGSLSVPFNNNLILKSEKFIEEKFSSSDSLLNYISSTNEKHEIYERFSLLQNQEFKDLLETRDIKGIATFIAQESKWISAAETNVPQPRGVFIPITAIAFFFVAVVGGFYAAGATVTKTVGVGFSRMNKFYSPIFSPETSGVLRAIAEYSDVEFAVQLDRYIINVAIEDIKDRYYSETPENELTF